jgi:hypothetical protein
LNISFRRYFSNDRIFILIFSKTPFFSKQYAKFTSKCEDKATAKLDAMVSALVLSKLPFPSCVMAQKTGQIFSEITFSKNWH